MVQFSLLSSNHHFQFLEIFPEDELPACQDLTNEEIEYGTECSNDTIPAEPRLSDPIFERLLAQLWEDYQTSMNANSSLFGKQTLGVFLLS